MTTSDKQFDSQFDKVENLVHYPWIGCNYASAPKRVLIMGSEGKGLSLKVKEKLDKVVSIKMARAFDSLNVSAAAAILCDRIANG